MHNTLFRLGILAIGTAVFCGCGIPTMSLKYEGAMFRFDYPRSLSIVYDSPWPPFEHAVEFESKDAMYRTFVVYEEWNSSGSCSESDHLVLSEIGAPRNMVWNGGVTDSTGTVSAG